MAGAARFRQSEHAGAARRGGYARRVRRFLLLLSATVVLVLLLLAWGYRNARADPIVRRAKLALPGWPAGAPLVRAVLISDVHVGSVTMDPARLTRIVAQVNALRPDIVLIAGDFASDHDRTGTAELAGQLRPLARLTPRLGVVATLGNHDHWAGPGVVSAALQAIGVTVLENAMVQRGPLTIGGAGDAFTRHQDMPRLSEALRGRAGARVVLTHSPDLAPALGPDMTLLLAGHTHCGQIVLPLYGPLTEVAAPRYRCGIIRESGRTIVVTGGLGTSVVPLRFGAPPDLWLLTLGPAAR